MDIKLSDFVDSVLVGEGDLVDRVIEEIKRLEAIEEALEEPDDNTEPEPPKEIKVRELVETDWGGGIEWVGYIPATKRFVMRHPDLYISTDDATKAHVHPDRTSAWNMCSSYNGIVVSGVVGQKAIPWPMPKS